MNRPLARLIATVALTAFIGPVDARASRPNFAIGSDDGNHTMKIGARLQSRFTLEAPDEGEEQYYFSIPRARLGLKGNVFGKELSYKFDADFAKGDVNLKDFFADYRFTDGVHLRVGQYKKPFSRQQLTSSGKLELIDRGILDKAFKTGRDIGVTVHSNYAKSPELEWAVGNFNGTGDKGAFDVSGDLDDLSVKRSNLPAQFKPTVVARIGYNSDDLKGYSEGDLEGGDLRFGAAASAMVDLGAADSKKAVRAQVDAIVKAAGFSATGGLYLTTATDNDDAMGFTAQASYLISKQIQPAVRFSMLMPDHEGADDTLEATGGLSVYFAKHSLKWQVDAGLIKTGEASEIIARSQFQISI